MVTTIQVNEKTLLLLKKLKEELNSTSYDDTINKVALQRTKNDSHAGSLKKYMKKESMKKILNNLHKERHKSDRF